MMKGSSEHHTLKFLNYLRANNYISLEGKEYVREEIDNDYFKKSERYAERIWNHEKRRRLKFLEQGAIA